MGTTVETLDIITRLRQEGVAQQRTASQALAASGQEALKAAQAAQKLADVQNKAAISAAKLDTAAQRVAIGEQRVSQSSAQAETAQNRAAQSAQRLATEQLRTEQAALRLALAQRRAAQSTQDASRAQQIAQQTAKSMASSLAGATVAYTGFSAVVDKTGVAFERVAKIQETKRAFEIIVGDSHRAAAAYKEATEFAAKFGYTQTELADSMSIVGRIMRSSAADVETILSVMGRLGQLSPEQGAVGASIAIQEALTGNTESLVRRFEISGDAIDVFNAAVKQGVDPIMALDQALSSMGATNELLAARMEGPAGALREYKVASENASIAWGTFIAGIEQKFGILQGLTTILNNATEATKQFSTASKETKSSDIEQKIFTTAGSFEEYARQITNANMQLVQHNLEVGIIGRAFGAAIEPLSALTAEQYTYAQSLIQSGASSQEAYQRALLYSDGIERGVVAVDSAAAGQSNLTGALSTTTSAIVAQNSAMVASIQESINAQLASESLKALQDDLVIVSSQVASGFYSKEQAAAVLQAKYGDLGGQIIQLIQLQMQLNSVMAVGGQQNTLMGRDAQRTDLGASKAIESAKAIRDQIIALGSTDANIARVRREMEGLNKDSASYIRKQTELNQLLDKNRKSGGSAGRKAGKTEAQRELERELKAQEKAAEKLADIRENLGEKLADIERETGEKLAQLQRDRQQAEWQSAKDHARNMDLAAHQRIAGMEANDLSGVGEDDPERLAQIAAREAAEDAALERQYQAQQQAYTDAQELGAEAAQEMYDIRTRDNEARQALHEEYLAKEAELRAQGKEKHIEELKREYEEALLAQDRATTTEIDIARMKQNDKTEAQKQETEAILAEAEKQKTEAIAKAQEMAREVEGAIAGQTDAVARELAEQNSAAYDWARAMEQASARYQEAVRQAQRAAEGLPGPTPGAAPPAIPPEYANRSIPSYDTGVRGAPGGLAEVHRDELIQLPRGSNVYNTGQTSDIHTMLRELSATVRELAGRGPSGPAVVQNNYVRSDVERRKVADETSRVVARRMRGD